MTGRKRSEFVFKVNLKGAKRIWRTIALGGNHTLHDLHEMIFVAFDRYDEHLYSFYFPKAPARRSSHRSMEFTAPFMFEDAAPYDEEGQRNAADARISTLDLKVGQKFEYLFDFGDSWWHEVEVEEIRDDGSSLRLPCVLEQRGKSPPQYMVEEET